MKDNSEFSLANAKDFIDTYLNASKMRFDLSTKPPYSKKCHACGVSKGYKFINIINDDLSTEWSLSEKMRKNFDIRESSKCNNCKSSYRSKLHAKAICDVFSPKSESLIDAVERDLSKLKIAEINACGSLHKILAKLPNLKYSEYRPNDPDVRHEDLTKLSYKDSTFDLVLTSETFEHLPDWEKAMSEINRVLVRGGVHIFTVPAIPTRNTRIRAIISAGKVKNIYPPSYHGYNRGITSDYLVFNEFGADFRKKVDGFGFRTKLFYRNFIRPSDPNFVYVSIKK